MKQTAGIKSQQVVQDWMMEINPHRIKADLIQGKQNGRNQDKKIQLSVERDKVVKYLGETINDRKGLDEQIK